MNKKRKIVIILIIINILATMIIGIYQNTVQATSQKISTDISGIDDEKYPEIKEMIQELQKAHPNWNFKLLYTGLEWKDVIAGETSSHGKNLIGANQSNYSGKWICSTCGTKKTYSGGNWLCASEEAIAYMMDPRNSLYDADIFQFLELSYDKNIKYDKSVLKEILEGTFLDDGNLDKYVETILSASKKYGINPYYITVKAIQEQGTKGGSTFKMQDTSEKNKNVYYYNIFNINATGGTKATIVANALIYAKKKELNTIEKCIEDGIEFIVDGYVSIGQNTMYFEKFDVIGPSYYNHQYAQDVMYAQNQGTRLRRDLEAIDAKEYGYTFIIPLYENMPEKACERPSITTTSTDVSQNSVIVKNNMQIDENNKTIMTVEQTKISNVLSTIGNTSLTVKDASGKKITDTNKIIGTGYKVGDYTVAVVGDANGDGKINSGDLYNVQKYLITKNELSDAVKQAMDVNYDTKINSGDLFYIQKYLLGNTIFEIK